MADSTKTVLPPARKNGKPLPEVSVQMVRETFDYEPQTGLLFFRTGSRAGQKAGRDEKIRTSIGVFGRTMSAHVLVWMWCHGVAPVERIDHIDCNPNNNRISNLRLANASLNAANQKRCKHNTSGFKGVGYVPHKKRWVARIQANKRQYKLGYYKTPQEAHEVYCLAADLLFGEFANHG